MTDAAYHEIHEVLLDSVSVGHPRHLDSDDQEHFRQMFDLEESWPVELAQRLKESGSPIRMKHDGWVVWSTDIPTGRVQFERQE